MPDFNPLFAPLLLPLPLPLINGDNENNLAPLLQWVPWPEVHFGVQFTDGAAINHGLLTPPLTPLPQFLEETQEEPNEPTPVFNAGMEEVPNDEFIYGPLDPMVIEVDNAQDPGPVGFDINLLFDEFHAIFDEDEENDVTYEEDDHAGVIIDGLFFETIEEEEGSDASDDMELDEVDSLL